MYLTSGKFSMIIFIFSMLCVFYTSPARGEISDIGFYGMSTHKDDNSGKGYQERNWGLSLHTTKQELWTGFYQFQIGAFRNSFDDLAYWAGVEVGKDISKYSILIDVRHWKTRRGTYDDRILVLYPKLRIQIHNQVAVDWLIRRSGHVFSLRYMF